MKLKLWAVQWWCYRRPSSLWPTKSQARLGRGSGWCVLCQCVTYTCVFESVFCRTQGFHEGKISVPWGNWMKVLFECVVPYKSDSQAKTRALWEISCKITSNQTVISQSLFENIIPDYLVFGLGFCRKCSVQKGSLKWMGSADVYRCLFMLHKHCRSSGGCCVGTLIKSFTHCCSVPSIDCLVR